jgi:glycosyltransferase involved in cell wall biosynthesis
MASLRAEAWMALKRALRPLIPDPVVARLRRPDHSDRARVNIDVVVEGDSEQRRWLRATPGTYRVRSRSSFGPAPTGGFEIFGTGDAATAILSLADPEIAAAAVAATAPPKVARQTVLEPLVAPSVIAVRSEVVAELGEPPSDLVALWARLRQFGRRLALVPGGPAAPTDRADRANRPVVVIAPVPLHDVGGGYRGAQMALELCRRGYHVAYVALYGSVESSDLGLRFVHPRLEEYRIDEFDAAGFVARAGEGGVVINQIPAAPALEPIRALRAGGFDVVYDLIDEWSDRHLGGWWWKPEIDAAHQQLATHFTASAPVLVARLRQQTRAEVTLVPNGVNPAIFTGDVGSRPDDLPAVDEFLSYHGSLYGEWFDWEALADVAERFSRFPIVLLGDARDVPAMPANVHFLGLKPQSALPAYIGRARATLIPFKVGPTTQAVSPLKAFESLAMGVPVAAPPLQPLENLDGVYLDVDLGMAVEKAMAAVAPDGTRAREMHGWGDRLGRMWKAGGRTLRPAEGLPVDVLTRPAVSHDPGSRLL